jgi:hypothetical protein
MKTSVQTSLLAVLLPLLLAACAATPPRHSTKMVEAVGKVVDNLSTETAQRLGTDAYRGLPVIVRTSAGTGSEPIVAEFLRTRLIERGVPVEVDCPARCMEVNLLEFNVDNATPNGITLTPGQIMSVAASAVPVLGGLTRVVSERERANQPQATGLLVTFSAREGNRYVGRNQLVAILSTSTAETAK